MVDMKIIQTPALEIVELTRTYGSGAGEIAALRGVSLAFGRGTFTAVMGPSGLVPLIGQCIDVAEWGAMSANAFQRFSGDKPWLVIGLIQEQLLPAENATMEANMPPPARDFCVGTGRPMFEEYVGALRS